MNNTITMLKLFCKLPLLKLYYHFGWPPVLPVSYVLLISTQCNARCKTCNIWKQKYNELGLAEWKKILRSTGRTPFWITISGGEPFLQPHLVELCRLIFRNCQPAILNIPTNSLAPDIPQKVGEIASSTGKSEVIINLSLDGVGKKHDEIRGVKGNFAAFEETYHALTDLKREHPNLTIGIHSVISKFNIDHAEKLFNYALSLGPDQYITEIAEERKELDTIGTKISPHPERYSQVIDILKAKMKARAPSNLSKITESFRFEYYNLVKRWLKERRQIIPCYAGVASCQISSWGEVWPCCVRGDDLGNLRDYNYNFKEIWFSEKANQVRKSVKNEACSCPLANAAYTNMLMNQRIQINVINNLIKSL